jgi:hypothetical protein
MLSSHATCPFELVQSSWAQHGLVLVLIVVSPSVAQRNIRNRAEILLDHLTMPQVNESECVVSRIVFWKFPLYAPTRLLMYGMLAASLQTSLQQFVVHLRLQSLTVPHLT